MKVIFFKVKELSGISNICLEKRNFMKMSWTCLEISYFTHIETMIFGLMHTTSLMKITTLILSWNVNFGQKKSQRNDRELSV